MKPLHPTVPSMKKSALTLLLLSCFALQAREPQVNLPESLDRSTLLQLAEAGFQTWITAEQQRIQLESDFKAITSPAELSWSREALGSGDQRETEDSFTISQNFRSPRHKKLLKQAIQAEAKSALLDLKSQRLRYFQQLELGFLNCYQLQESAKAWLDWDGRVAQSQAAIAAMLANGHVAGLDARRMALVRGETASELARIHALLNEAWLQLAALAALPTEPRPSFIREAEQTQQAESASESPAQIYQEILASEASAASERAQAQALWLKEFRLEGGYKHSDNSNMGYILGFAIPLTRKKDSMAPLLRARAAQLETQLQREQQRQKGQRAALQQRLQALTALAADYRQTSLPASEQLFQLTELAYREGEASLLELLDAHRTHRDTQLRLIELEGQVLATQLEQRYFQGGQP